jgi:hypothetical protein
MTSETDKNAHIAQDHALFGKIETLYREADDLGDNDRGQDNPSGPLEASVRVRSQDPARLPIIGSLPVRANSDHDAPNHLADESIPLSSISKNDLMTSIVLTGMVSRPGAEKEQIDPLPVSGALANEPIDNHIIAPTDDPFIAIRNAVETAGQTGGPTSDNRKNVSNPPHLSSQTKELAAALAVIIKEQIDNAIDDRLSAPDGANSVDATSNLNTSSTNKNITATKRAAAKSVLKKAAKLARHDENASVKPKAKSAKAKLSAKKTEATAKAIRKKSSKGPDTKND